MRSLRLLICRFCDHSSRPHEPERGCVVLDQPQRAGDWKVLRLASETAPLLCGVAAMVTSNQGSAAFSICDLGGLGGCSNTTSSANGISGTGKVVGSAVTGAFCDEHAFVSTVSGCPPPPLIDISGGSSGTTPRKAFGINLAGNRVVGITWDNNSGIFHAFRASGLGVGFFDLGSLRDEH